MTKEDFLEKYGKVLVTFEGYYKFVFTYRAELEDESVLYVSVGGNSDDIYKLEVAARDKDLVLSLDPFSGEVYKKDGELVESFYDY